MENLPKNWKLIEAYDGNFIFEDDLQEFSVSVDQMGAMNPPYEICYQQLKGEYTKIRFEKGGYSTHGFDEKQAIQKAVEMMLFINKNKPQV